MGILASKVSGSHSAGLAALVTAFIAVQIARIIETVTGHAIPAANNTAYLTLLSALVALAGIGRTVHNGKTEMDALKVAANTATEVAKSQGPTLAAVVVPTTATTVPVVAEIPAVK